MIPCRALNAAWRAASLPAAARFAAALADPGAHQRRTLGALVRRHAASAFGTAHGFASTTDSEDFRRRVPARDWNGFVPWIDRIRGGEARVLTCDPVLRLVPTGGSTGGAKAIPWTAGSAREFQATIAPWIVDLGRAHPAAFAGSAYWSITPPGEADGEQPSDVGFADDTAYLGGPLAALVRPLLATPTALGALRDPQAFIHATLRCLLARGDLTLISVWHPSYLGLLLDAAVASRERLIADIADGGISSPIPPAVRCALGRWLAPDRARAALLQRADWTDPRALWPALALVSCWADAAAAMPARALAARLRGVPIQAKGLLATEAAISLPYRGGPVAAVTGPVIELLGADGEARWLDQAEDGHEYEVLLTTAGGLWRYRIGDRVRVEGFAGRTPRLRFLGRTGATCDLVGEKLDEAFVATCLGRALPMRTAFALLAPNDDGSAGYTLFADTPIDAATLTSLDRALGANPQWRLARRLGQLAEPRAMLVGADAPGRWFAAHARTALGAVKPAALDRRRGWGARLGATMRDPDTDQTGRGDQRQ